VTASLRRLLRRNKWKLVLWGVVLGLAWIFRVQFAVQIQADTHGCWHCLRAQ